MKTQSRTSYILLDEHDKLIERVCSTCKELKSRDEFYVQKTGPGGHHTSCKRCLNKKAAKSNKSKRRTGRARERLIPEVSLRAHNEKMIQRAPSGEFKLQNVKTRSVSPGIIIHEAHPGEHIVCLRKRIQGVTELVLLEMSMDGDTLQEMLLHNHWKIIERKLGVSSKLSEEVTQVENLRRLPFSSESLNAMIQSHTYYLWMDSPRPLTPDEISDVYDIPKRSLEFILTKEKLAIPPGGDILENKDA